MIIFNALKNRNYRLFFTGQGLSNLGNLIQQVAIGWLAYRLTDSAFVLGLVTFSQQFTTFLAAPVAGVVADRSNKHRLLMWVNALLMINSFLLALLTVLGLINIGLMIAIQLAFGCIKGIEMTTRQAFINDLVDDKTILTSAIALNSTLFNTARIVGPAIAGILIPLAGEAFCFIVYSVMSLAVTLTFLYIRYRPQERIRPPAKFIAELTEGWKYSFGNPPIRTLMLLVTAISLFGMPYTVLLPVFAGEVFNAGAQGFGYMNSAIGLGSVAGALYLGNKQNVLGMDKLLVITAVVFGLGVAGFAFSPWLWVALVALLASGFGRVIVFAASNTLLQTIADDSKRGRVLSLHITLFMGAHTFGSLGVGALADLIGAPYTIALGGLGCIIAALVFSRNSSALRFKTYRIFHELKVS
jgi:MFS family permease